MPRPSKYVSRSDLGWGSSPAEQANPRSGLVIHYDSSDQNLANKNHSSCVTYWRNTRSFHTGPSRGWADIGYSWMACPHGYVLEGRGLYRTQAAQPGGNSSHYSCTLATGPSDPITPDQINAVRQLRQWLMEPDTSISGKVLGHRDFISTSCPGDKAYALVKDGTFAKAPGNTEGDDDMPSHRRFEKDKAQKLEPGSWASLAFDKRHDGETGEFYALVGVEETKGAYYDISVGVTLEGLDSGAEAQIRLTEYEPNGDGGWKVARNRPIDSPVHVGGRAHFTYSWKGNLGEGRRVRVRVAQYGKVEAQVTSATADVFYWKR
ncbi:peptidoglycan recognition protein family protein [Nocardiopsis eucommiae]|uniref:peptidoglycan recognition protein family protein n=1 Tax=Nocardiopsis eucommiae TaxID=2831970 RepID=UPI003D744FB6